MINEDRLIIETAADRRDELDGHLKDFATNSEKHRLKQCGHRG